MADSVTTSNAGASSAPSTKTSGKAPDGFEDITIRVPKDRPDETLFQLHLAELTRVAGGGQPVIVGNIADVQRMGAAVVTGKKIEDGILNPPNTIDGEQQPLNAMPFEDVIAPGPAAMGADAAEAAFGDRVAQGDRPES